MILGKIKQFSLDVAVSDNMFGIMTTVMMALMMMMMIVLKLA